MGDEIRDERDGKRDGTGEMGQEIWDRRFGTGEMGQEIWDKIYGARDI